jgi:hypothetical protein
VAAKAQILGFVHLSHPARAYLVQDTVVRNRGGMHGTRVRGKGSPQGLRQFRDGEHMPEKEHRMRVV